MMAKYIDVEELKRELICNKNFYPTIIKNALEKIPPADVVEVVRCRDCICAIELDKHCEINSSAYKHCTLLRGEYTKNVWHKYKKYYKDYSLVEPNDYCSFGERRDKK